MDTYSLITVSTFPLLMAGLMLIDLFSKQTESDSISDFYRAIHGNGLFCYTNKAVVFAVSVAMILSATGYLDKFQPLYVFAPGFILLLSYPWILLSRKLAANSYSCSSCNESIFFKTDWSCQSCGHTNTNRKIINKCKKCKKSLTSIGCPQCGTDIKV